MSNVELKPCPFCQSDKIRIDTYDSGYKCSCNNCGCNSKVIDWGYTARDKDHKSIFEFPERKARGIELATEAWNNREFAPLAVEDFVKTYDVFNDCLDWVLFGEGSQYKKEGVSVDVKNEKMSEYFEKLLLEKGLRIVKI